MDKTVATIDAVHYNISMGTEVRMRKLLIIVAIIFFQACEVAPETAKAPHVGVDIGAGADVPIQGQSCAYDNFVKNGNSWTNHTSYSYKCTVPGYGNTFRFAFYTNGRGYYARGFNSQNWFGGQITWDFRSNCAINGNADNSTYDMSIIEIETFSYPLDMWYTHHFDARIIDHNAGLDFRANCRQVIFSYCNNDICF